MRLSHRRGAHLSAHGRPALQLPGFETPYLSLGWRTVFREVSGGFAHRLTPYVLVHHDVDCEDIADLLTEAARAAHGVSLADLSHARGDALIAGREPARA